MSTELNIVEEEPSVINVHSTELSKSKSENNVELSPRQNLVTEHTNNIESLTKMVSDGFENYNLDENNIVEYIIRIMSLVEQQKNLTGIEKKAVVIEILLRLVDSYDKLSEESKQKLKLIIRTIAPSIIESIIAASKGLIAVNKKIEESSKKCCFCFFK